MVTTPSIFFIASHNVQQSTLLSASPPDHYQLVRIYTSSYDSEPAHHSLRKWILAHFKHTRDSLFSALTKNYCNVQEEIKWNNNSDRLLRK